MSYTTKQLLCLSVGVLLLAPASLLYAAPGVVPIRNATDGTKLTLSYSDIPEGVVYVVKRTIGIPTPNSVWVALTGRPMEDSGLVPDTEYTYALFDEQGTILPNQSFSKIPRPVTGQSNTGGGGAEDPNRVFTPVAGGGDDRIQYAPESQIEERSEGRFGGSEGAELVTLADFFSKLRDILNTLIPFIIGLAVFVILWGIFTYLSHAAEEEKQREAKQFVLYGIIGVFLMLSIWGFVNILVNTFNLEKTIEEGAIPRVPDFELGAANDDRN